MSVYARYEFSTRFMLSSSDCESRTIGDLRELEPGAQEQLLETWCGYTESPGGPELRQAIASLYERTGAEEVVATSCAEGIFLLYHALLRPGDHVIVETPCYESALQRAMSMSGLFRSAAFPRATACRGCGPAGSPPAMLACGTPSPR